VSRSSKSSEGKQVYYSGKDQPRHALDCRGEHKLRTSIKEITGRDLGDLGLEKIDRSSVGSPMSYQTEEMYDEGINYYQPKESREEDTFQRNPYE
jgi:hypothetical protein